MGKRKHRSLDSDDDYKENRLSKKMDRLMKAFEKHRDRIRKKRSRDCDSESEHDQQKRSRSSKDKDLTDQSQSPSRTSAGSPPGLLEDSQSPSRENILTFESPENVLDNLETDLPQDVSASTAKTQADTPAEVQLADKPEENVSTLNDQNTCTSDQDQTILEDLNVEILEAIGKRVAEDRILTPAIPKSIAVRLEDIIKKGLPKEEKEKLIKEHAPPKNCILIDPPKLNEEIKVSINKTSTKRDNRIVEKQKKITACLALMGSSITDIIKENPKLAPSQITLVKKLSEAARLMADLQRDETMTRRSLILAAINAAQKETLELTEADEWLFGQKLGERLKAAKTIERSGKDLKTKSKSSGKPKNFKGPPRRQPFKSRTWGGYQNKMYNQKYNKKSWGNQHKGDHNSQSQAPAQKKT